MCFDELERLVKDYDWKPNCQSTTTYFRRGNYSTSVGLTYHWGKPGCPLLPSVPMVKDPSIYNECKKLFHDFDFDSVIINKNLLCPPHKDSNNIGDSLIVGLGDYSYGDLVINDEAHCILYSPLIFNGNKNTHYTEDFTGDRYSVILCKSKFRNLK